MIQILITALVAAAMAAGLVAGVFLSFSDFVMRSLSAAAPQAGIEAMQLINRKVYRSVFMVLLMGLGPLALILALLAADRPQAVWVWAGALVYLIGVMAVSVLRNVPMNQRLDRINRHHDTTAAYWGAYTRTWTWWNHIRTLAAGFAAIFFIIAALQLAQTA
jgi:uncharacterized membrane protein